MLVALLFSAAFLVEPAGASTPVAAPAAAPATPAVKDAADAKPKTAAVDPERVCRLEATLGSKITKKVCYNRAVMAARTFDDKQNLDLIQSQTYMKSHE
ncbi:MAG: hypothetical protein ACREE0_23340 [Phenylobacterium sp.]